MVKLAIIVVFAACSSGRGKAVDDGVHAPTAVAPHPSPSPSPSPSPTPTSGSGDLQVRVEWHDVPVIARASPGRTPCGTARLGDVAPTTTWGIPDVFIVLTGDRAKPAPEPNARVVFDHCALAPRVVVAGAQLAVASTADSPVALGVARRGTLKELGQVSTDPPKPLQLPIAGHDVAVPLEAGAIYEVTGADTNAWILSAPDAYAGLTDASGASTLRELPAGHYAITAWLPPRAGQPAHAAHGEVNVTNGALAEVTLDLAR